MSRFIKKLRSRSGDKKSKKGSSQSSSRAGPQSESSRKASSGWKKASKDLGIFKPAESQYNEVKSILDNDRTDHDNKPLGYDVWWKKDGSTMISIDKPDGHYHALEGKTLGHVTFDPEDVNNEANWSRLKSCATNHTEEGDWTNGF